MKRYRALLPGMVAAIGMAVLILDSKTAIAGARDGVELCIKCVVPALFPFCLLSNYLTRSAVGTGAAFLRPIGKLCGIPNGSEGILITGLLGGYPVGAQCIAQSYAAGRICKDDARRMLGFCNNAGPAFLFGMTALLFDSKTAPFLLWLIQILSAILTGVILPGKSGNAVLPLVTAQQKPGQALQQSIKITASVCGWVVIFRTILAFAERWFLWMLPPVYSIIITGILELTNGYLRLDAIDDPGLRFLLASIFLAFGGICVMLQTLSATSDSGLELGCYLSGKPIQTAISAGLSILISRFLFSGEAVKLPTASVFLAAAGVILFTAAGKRKIYSSIPGSSGV